MGGVQTPNDASVYGISRRFFSKAVYHSLPRVCPLYPGFREASRKGVSYLLVAGIGLQQTARVGSASRVLNSRLGG